MRKITPSNIDPWHGTPVDGSPYTAEQLQTMRTERPTWTRFSDRAIVLRAEATAWAAPVEVTVQCPIIAWTKDKARVLIITPAGMTKWTDAARKKAA